ncbi:hypothetical protein [Bradyrhizobium oligotrophicum]|uniref:hypothetical protein n=1 Tax=Bradyrhizobium oligotrophicum TaxID=44255 RepID=UPI003EBC39B4
MAERDREQMELVCPRCGAKGIADTSTPDSPFAMEEGFSVDKLSEGFSLATDGKGARAKTEIRHVCGATFKL